MAIQGQDKRAPAVALLFEDAEQIAYLREALSALGARIVHEGPATGVERQALLEAGADVVVINLDDTVDAHLDQIYEAVDESRHRVVFNDAAATRDLSGWDQARWARHLAAKLLDATDVDPPRPADAQAVEVPVASAADEHATTVMTTPDGDDAGPASALDGDADGDRDDENDSEALGEQLTHELQALLDEGDSLLGEAGADVTDAGVSPGAVDDAEFDDADDVDAGVSVAPIDDSEFGADDAGLFAGLDATADDDGLLDADTLFAGMESASSAAVADADAGADVDAAADADADAKPAATDPAESSQAEANDAPATFKLDELSLADADADAADAGADADAGDAEGAEQPSARERVQVAAPDWDLVDFGGADDADTDSDDGTAVTAASAASGASAFGIEKVSASEFLMPDAEATEGQGESLEPGLSLELVSLEEAMAPSVVESTGHEMLLDASHGLRRLVAISAGADDGAVLHDFLSALPEQRQTALMLVIHGDAEALAAALQGATRMRVRAAEGDVILHPGELLTVDAAAPVRVGRDGRVRPAPGEQDAATLLPSAQVFGPDLLALVFGGPAAELAAEAAAVREAGGRVWTHAGAKPGSAAARVQADGLAEQQGDAAALAARLAAELGLS